MQGSTGKNLPESKEQIGKGYAFRTQPLQLRPALKHFPRYYFENRTSRRGGSKADVFNGIYVRIRAVRCFCAYFNKKMRAESEWDIAL